MCPKVSEKPKDVIFLVKNLKNFPYKLMVMASVHQFSFWKVLQQHSTIIYWGKSGIAAG